LRCCRVIKSDGAQTEAYREVRPHTEAKGRGLSTQQRCGHEPGRRTGQERAITGGGPIPCGPDCKDCHGKPKRVRADNLRSGRVVSCGKIKRAMRRDYMVFQRANSGGRYEPTEADSDAAESVRTHLIDAVTGAEIAMADIKSIRRPGCAPPLPERPINLSTRH